MNRKQTTVQRQLGKAARQLIGKRIAERRKALGLTQIEVAARLSSCIGQSRIGLCRQYIENFESQREERTSTISIPSLYGLAACLEVEPGDLLPNMADVMEKAGISLVKKQITVETWSVKDEKDSSL